MKAVTIDQIGIKNHQRYAEDQKLLDPKFLRESNLIPGLSEINGTSSIYASQLEQLFEVQIRNIPWANFLPPPRYRTQAKRFFSHRILPTIYWGLIEEKEEGEELPREHKNYMEMIDEVLQKVKDKGSASDHCLKESNTLVNLLESIGELNAMLDQIQARRMQYQKG